MHRLPEPVGGKHPLVCQLAVRRGLSGRPSGQYTVQATANLVGFQGALKSGDGANLQSCALTAFVNPVAWREGELRNGRGLRPSVEASTTMTLTLHLPQHPEQAPP